MARSHSVAILFTLLPALTTASPWYRRETPNSPIVDNAGSTYTQASSVVTTDGAGATSSVYTTSSAATSLGTLAGASNMYGTTVITSTAATSDGMFFIYLVAVTPAKSPSLRYQRDPICDCLIRHALRNPCYWGSSHVR